MIDKSHIETFEQVRPKLLGLAYRILGSLSDAEDIVQDTYVKWTQVNSQEVENPDAYLMKVSTRKCLDLLKSAHHSRVDYVGEWLPEPIQTESVTADQQMELASSLRVAFLLMLDRLSPKERAAYLLREIFGVDYSSVSKTLSISESACRKLVSRAKSNVQKGEAKYSIPDKQQNRLLHAFQHAVKSGATNKLEELLASDVNFIADHGGKAQAIQKTLEGQRNVCHFISQDLRIYWQNYSWIAAEINGYNGFILKENGHTVTCVAFEFNGQNQIANIFAIRNPDKLQRLDNTTIH